MRWYVDEGLESDVVISSRIRLARNLKAYYFPLILNPEQAQLCYMEIRDVFFSANTKMHENYLDVALKDLSLQTVLSLVEKHLISEDLVKYKNIGRAIIKTDESISIMLGEEDHIRIQSMQPGLNFQQAYDEATKISLLFEEKLPIAYTKQLGFLTACPSNIGTGLRASAMLHLPGLSSLTAFGTYIEKLRKSGYAVRGYYGEHTDAIGHLFQISNQQTLGVSEEESIAEMNQVIHIIIEEERKVRKLIWDKNETKIKDRTFRAYGLMQNAHMMSMNEAMDHISALRLGVSMGILPDLSQMQLNAIMAEIGPGTIQQKKGEEMPDTERDAERSKIIKTHLSKTKETFQEDAEKESADSNINDTNSDKEVDA